MAEVHQLPDPVRIEEEASQWIARLHADNVTADDRARFNAWRNAHPLNERTYEAMHSAWRAFHAAGPVVRAVSFGQSMNEATLLPKRSWRRWALGAATAMVLIAAVCLYWVKGLPETQFQTAIGERASVVLPDGSTVELNSNSAVRVSYSDRSRVIQLKRGEAFFNVTHDVARPFWVVAGGSWVRAVGTAFNVYVRPQGVQVTVSEGTVQVGSSEASGTRIPTADELARGAASILSAGEQADVRAGTASIQSLPLAEVRRSISWRSGKISFDKQPLGTVIDELRRYTPVELIVTDDKLRQLQVGGTFQSNPQGAETLISMLKDGFGLRIRRESGRVYIDDEPSPAR